MGCPSLTSVLFTPSIHFRQVLLPVTLTKRSFTNPMVRSRHHFRRSILGGMFLALPIAFPWGSPSAQPVSPRDGGPLPPAYYERIAKDPTAFQFKHAWLREGFEVAWNRRAVSRGELTAMQAAAMEMPLVVAGTKQVPVLLGKFSNTVSEPWAHTVLQTRLFDGPHSPRTMAEYYAEISGGRINLSGTVYPWKQVSNTDIYYAGTANGLGGDSQVQEYLYEVLTLNDPSVDFSIYDNDGPDGLPNSGDDDGFVDFVAFVHPEIGGECRSNNNIWSHRWVYSAWPASGDQPYTTNDPAAGGGFIRVEDYAVLPALACGGGTIQIGVFCHEFGHGFGLPDLYDAELGQTGTESAGIGHWGLMGSGNWNTPDNPAHMSAWSKDRLGWVDVTEVGPGSADYSVEAVATSGRIYRLPWSTDKFRRRSDCAIGGSYSMWVGLTAAEAQKLNWKSSATPGYGNGWDETVSRDFFYDGSGSVTLSFDYSHQLERDYDFVYLQIEVLGTTKVLKTYTGNGSGNQVVDLSPHVSAGIPYRISFRMTSDFSYSDQDGNNATSCGAFAFDNVSVTGGGESYSSDFEQFEDGWFQDPASNPVTEYFLVENRQRQGSDQGLYTTGLAIWHVDDDISKYQNGNSGGVNNLQPHGVKLEEADNRLDLYKNVNRGDAGDLFPGNTSNMGFRNGTAPNSKTNAGKVSGAGVTLLGPSSSSMSVRMTAGDPAPVLTSVVPPSGENLPPSLDVVLDGLAMRNGATWKLTRSGQSDVVASNVEWIGFGRIAGAIDLDGAAPGAWDVEVMNPDGQTFVLAGGFQVTDTAGIYLTDVETEVVGGSVYVRWTTGAEKFSTGFHVRRAEDDTGPFVRITAAPIPAQGAGSSYEYVDDGVTPGLRYFYQVEEMKASGPGIVFGPYEVSFELLFALDQNFPNPFNPNTTIGFSLANDTNVRLTVFDLQGRTIRILADGFRTANVYQEIWDGRDDGGRRVASGVYFYRLETPEFESTKKMMLLK